MTLPARDVSILRELARRVAEIAADPAQDEKRALWYRVNRLERVRPLIHVQAVAANIWEELLPPETFQCTDEFCRLQERDLRRRIYVWEHWGDDRVIDAVVRCYPVVEQDIRRIDFGMKPDLLMPDAPSGAYAMRNVLEDEKDIEKIRIDVPVKVNEAETEAFYEKACEVYDGILNVQKSGIMFFWMPVMDVFIRWRGIEQMFVDLIERPDWVHAALERMTTGYLNNLDHYEALGLLSPANGNVALGSGGYAWTDELPRSGFDGVHARTGDLWARCATQIFTGGISPAMHDEFAIRYEKRLLERFGLSCYGCCEPLHNKMDIVRKIGNLRRVSMSPWVDIDKASAEVGRDYVYTHKPNPTIVSMEKWHPDLARAELRDAFEKTRDNVIEVNLQDLHTVRNEPHRLDEWSRIALELSEEYA